MKRLVVVRPDRLGDCVVSSALLRPLAERWGGEREIVWCVKKAYAPLWSPAEKISDSEATSPGANIPPKPIPADRGLSPSNGTSPMPADATSGEGGWAEAPLRCVALEELENFLEGAAADIIFLNADPTAEKIFREGGHRVYSWGKTLPDRRKKCEKPEAAYAAELLAAAGFPVTLPERPQPLLAPGQLRPKVFDRPYVVLHVGAYAKKPTLPAVTFAALSRELLARGLRVVWVGLDATREDFAELCAAGQSLGVEALAGERPLGELLSYLRGARGVIGRDSAIAHLAAALGTPTVALIGPLAKKPALRRWGINGERALNLESPLRAGFWEGITTFQRRVFASFSPREILGALETLWR